jgi:hypothetical protein
MANTMLINNAMQLCIYNTLYSKDNKDMNNDH